MRINRVRPADPASAAMYARLADALASPSFSLTERQRQGLELLDGPQRHTLFFGGSRGGKTFVFIFKMLERALAAPATNHGCFRLTAAAARSSLALDTLPKCAALCFPDATLTEHRLDGYFELPNKSRIFIAGLDDKERVDKILGTEFLTLFFNEASQIPFSSITTALTRLAQSARGVKQAAFYDLNPVGKSHWSNLQFLEHRDPISRKPLADPENYAHMFFDVESNAANLDPSYIESLKALPLRQRMRFYSGQFQDETPGALWTSETLERLKVDPSQVPQLSRVVVAVDPSGAGSTSDVSHDAIGIVVCGLGVDGHGYCLADHTLHASPAEWGRKAAWAFHAYRADSIVVEVNFGGAMAEHVIRTADPSVPVKQVTSSRGKALRAEPVAALAESRPHDNVKPRIHHVAKSDESGRDHLADLEDELMGFTTTGYTGERSPNRADAYVIAMAELMTVGSAQGWVDYYSAMARGEISSGPPRLDEIAARARARAAAPAVVKLMAPPWTTYYVGRTRYLSDDRGEITADPAHVESLLNAGCRKE